MVARGASSVAALLVLAGVAAADPAPRPVDIKAYKDQLVLFKDAEGGVYAVRYVRGEETHVFYGTAKVLYEQVLDGGSSRDGDAWSVAVAAPRLPYPFTGLVGRRKDGTFYRSCGNDLGNAELTEITGDKAKELLDKAQFRTTSMTRKPYMLARDDRGVYYFVDTLRPVYGGAGHRVFVGKKGALRQLALTDVTTDSAGDVFSTKTGDLRLVRTISADRDEKPQAQWIRGEKKSELIYLDLYMNQTLIYKELGLYKIPGTICGNM